MASNNIKNQTDPIKHANNKLFMVSQMREAKATNFRSRKSKSRKKYSTRNLNNKTSIYNDKQFIQRLILPVVFGSENHRHKRIVFYEDYNNAALTKARKLVIYLCHTLMGWDYKRLSEVFLRDISSIKRNVLDIEIKRDNHNIDKRIETLEKVILIHLNDIIAKEEQFKQINNMENTKNYSNYNAENIARKSLANRCVNKQKNYQQNQLNNSIANFISQECWQIAKNK